MLLPYELERNFPVNIGYAKLSTGMKVWAMLHASYHGDLQQVKQLLEEEPALAYAQYNYMPPVHLAVREGHTQLVDHFLSLGACDPGYKTYPFQDNLVTLARDRGHEGIAERLLKYAEDPGLQKYGKDNGAILYPRTEIEQKFEYAVDRNNLAVVEQMLKTSPEIVHDPTFFWGEGILMMPAKKPDIPMLDLLLAHGAKAFPVLKWVQAYYFETVAGMEYMLQHGMDPDTMNCHHVTGLHNMAYEGDVERAKMLIDHGADINAVCEEYQSTPLGYAAHFGNLEMVKYLLNAGANPNKSGADWSTPMAWAIKKGHIEIAQIL